MACETDLIAAIYDCVIDASTLRAGRVWSGAYPKQQNQSAAGL